VLPSLSEGLSNALLEYMAVGKPVVATAVGGNLEVIRDRENGLLVPAGNASALAKAMLEIIEDQTLAEKLGAAGRKTIEEKFDLSKHLKRLEDVLVEVYKSAKGDGGETFSPRSGG
jgi:glycosyltransferase involved in cell wall biosynthesis